MEINEGVPIATSEWIALGTSFIGGYYPAISMAGRLYMAYDTGIKGGPKGVLYSYCLGPRVGNELSYRKVRTKEWLQLVPCVCIYPAISIPLEAYQGKTMTEIEQKEGLRK